MITRDYLLQRYEGEREIVNIEESVQITKVVVFKLNNVMKIS